MFVFFKQKTAYGMRISDWSSDVFSSDLIDILVNNAGLTKADTFDNTDAVFLRRMLDVNIVGSFLGMKATRDAMRDNGGGVVINIASEIGRASCRERVCQYVSISVVAVSLKKNKSLNITIYIDNTIHCRTEYYRDVS